MYWGEHAEGRRHYILENLRERRLQIGAYVIIAGRNGNLYEIHPAASLCNPALDSSDWEILGIGYGYRDTLRLLKKMVEERFQR